ncbi:hypothetical protein N9W83_07270 [Planktomarina temperata]|jgi:hypothetical protein|nr:hypothetical protein [Planktomarina temperata]
MSHWEAPEITNNMYETIRKRFMPMIKSLGATQCFEVQTSDTTVSIIAIYPDEVTFI